VGRSEARDVDGDGRPDLVMTLPRLRVDAESVTDFRDLPPAFVAHRAEDGRYHLDDAVTRTALRALCPAAPPRDRHYPHDAEDHSVRPQTFVEALFLDGLCHRVHGASTAEAVLRVREIVLASGETFANLPREPLEAALEQFPVPLTLAPLQVAPLAPLPRRLSAVSRTATAPDARCNDTAQRWVAWNAHAEQALHALPDDSQRPPLPDTRASSRFCIATDAGRWTLLPTGMSLQGDDNPELTAPVRLTWTPSNPRGPRETSLDLTLSATEHLRAWWEFHGAHDYDGDGAAELIVDDDSASPEMALRVWTVRDGRIVPYTPAEELREVRDVHDVDHDGRPDLVLPSPWSIRDTCGRAGIVHDGPTALAHALPGGGFSTTDAVARAWMLQQCTDTARGAPSTPDVLDVACARLSGSDPEHSVAALHARWPAGPQRVVASVRDAVCLTFQQVAAMALVPLPRFDPSEAATLPR